MNKDIERKIYVSWAFTENQWQKSKINGDIYKELASKYRVTSSFMKGRDNEDDYDIIFDRTSGYANSDYRIIKNNTKLSIDELALLADKGDLCFGYRFIGNTICVDEY